MIRPAKIKDVKIIAKIINQHAEKGMMLPIALNQIYEQFRDFIVAEEEGEIIGCGAIHVAWDNLGEIRSLAIEEGYRRKGLGSLLVKKLLSMAREIEIKKIFILTYQVDFFKRFGFNIIEKEMLPHKIWQACLNCPRFPNCDEIAMMLEEHNNEIIT